MRAEQKPVLTDLDGVGDEANADDLPDVAVADAVGGASEAHRSGGVDLAQDLVPNRESSGSGCLGSPVHPIVIICRVPTRLGGHEDAAVRNLTAMTKPGQTRSCSYDAWGRSTGVTLPVIGTIAYGYDALDRQATRTKAGGAA